MSEIKWWEEHERLWNELVPRSGQADSVQGELIRCCGKLTDEAYRNGNINWESGYALLARWAGKTLADPKTFTPQELERIAKSVDEIVRNYDTPDLSGHGSAYYYLSEMAVRWCLSNPDLRAHDHDPDLRV